jgi:hypothetical protein
MSNEQVIRVRQAINETERFLAKELSYMTQHQNAGLIAGYRAHLSKLRGMLA